MPLYVNSAKHSNHGMIHATQVKWSLSVSEGGSECPRDSALFLHGIISFRNIRSKIEKADSDRNSNIVVAYRQMTLCSANGERGTVDNDETIEIGHVRRENGVNWCVHVFPMFLRKRNMEKSIHGVNWLV